jgi:hypothetical protein
MCHFELTLGGPKICTSSGDMPACRLCPSSPTYWRNDHRPASDTPWDGQSAEAAATLDLTGWRDNRTDTATAEQTRCTMCGLPTTWTSPKGTRCHPSCAQQWQREHARPTTAAPSPTAQT